ncbi:hypothetical protein [Staphylococcus epidermidis]|uniref:hypothetical protein n=1 Tax=Staphylococcus epidermidis TaxID=1282 RepID=UPI0011A8602B|nr:hypothetical protein [Staphylococcus epidermidis]
MGKSLNKVMGNGKLSKEKKKFLLDLMLNNKTRDTLIKHPLSKHSNLPHKSPQPITYPSRNDVPFLYPNPQSQPILLLIFTNKHNKTHNPNHNFITQTPNTLINQF